MVLKHLQLLSQWDKNGGTPTSLGVSLQGKIDFSQVGLMGHSRGGEGVRAAYNLYRDSGSLWPTRILSPVTFRGIFEIAPVDGYSSRVLNADGTKWNVLLPMCDGDLVDLQGVKPFDRMMALTSENPATQKSTYTVWGAVHNFYNTEWQQSDSNGCLGHALMPQEAAGSAAQRQTSLGSLVAFFRANVGVSMNPNFNQNFNPRYRPPTIITSVTRVDEGFTPSPNLTVTKVFDDFSPSRGTAPAGVSDYASNSDVNFAYGIVPNHDSSLKAGLINWIASGTDRYFQSNWTPAGSGSSVSGYQTLEFRISRQNSNYNPSGPTTFSIQLVLADGSVSAAVKLCNYADVRGPVGGRGGPGGSPAGLHPILQTVRIPLADFTNANLSQVRGVRFIFDGTATGAIYLANIRFAP